MDLRKRCKGLCCRYFAFPIETPEDWDDYDDIRWYLAHKNVNVFVEDGHWYLNVKISADIFLKKTTSAKSMTKDQKSVGNTVLKIVTLLMANMIMTYILKMTDRWKPICG